MDIIEIQTLIDITNTRVIRLVQGTQLALDQNRNFITLLQCIELRSIISYNSPPTCEKIDIKSCGFGTVYKGKHMVWTFKFMPDRQDAYLDERGRHTNSLSTDLHQVPVIKNLLETLNIDIAVFDLESTEYKNTVIKMLPGIL